MASAQSGKMPQSRLFMQAKTFGPSKQDILEQLGGLFGPPAQPEKLDEYTDYHAAIYDLPTAYIGQSVVLRETINNLITNAPENWQTTVGLPFKFIDGLTIKWDEMTFDRSILPRVPYEGASRMQTSIRRTHRDRVVRRGAAITAESDFYRTEAGLNQFSMEVRSVQQCVQLTVNYDVMFAYLTHGGYAREHEIRKQIVNTRNIMTYMRRQIQTYAVLCKGEDNGLDIALETARRLMADYSVSPNMVIMDPATQIYVRMVPDSNKQQYLAGQTGVDNYNSFNGGQGIANFRGLTVYVQNSFDVGEGNENINMLQRQTQVGEYYVMQPPRYISNKPLPPTYMDIMIYDENLDKLVVIDFGDAVEHAVPWNLNLVTDKFNFTGHDATIKRSLENLPDAKKTEILAEATKIKPGSTSAPTELDNIPSIFNDFLADNKTHWRAAVAMAKLGLWIPLTVVVTRPFIEHRMLSMIVTVGGSDTGLTVYGQSDFQISRNTSVKTIEGHFTFHSKAVITKPKNVFILEDVQCTGYIAGCDTTWFGDKAAAEDSTKFSSEDDDVKRWERIRNDMKARLDQDYDENPAFYASMLAFASPYDPDGKFHQAQMFTISGGPLAWESTMSDDRNFPGGMDFFNAYRTKMDLNYIPTGTDPQSIASQNFVRNGTSNNSVVILGPSRCYNPTIDTAFDLTPGQGHFGPDALPGDARWRRGEAVNAKQARSNQGGASASMELLAQANGMLGKRLGS